jgi:hypothetical protein
MFKTTIPKTPSTTPVQTAATATPVLQKADSKVSVFEDYDTLVDDNKCVSKDSMPEGRLESKEITKLPLFSSSSAFEQLAQLVKASRASPVAAQLYNQLVLKNKKGTLGGSLIDPRTRYRFRMTVSGDISASAGGVIDAVLTGDPSSDTDWSSITAIFNAGRQLRQTVHFVFQRTTGQNNFPKFIVGSDECSASAPGGYPTVAACADSSVHPTDVGSSAVKFSHTRKPIVPCSFVDLAGTLQPGPYAGFTGSIMFYASACDANLLYLGYLEEHFIEVCGRTS